MKKINQPQEKSMTNKISRRDFLKLAGMAAAASAVLTGCGPASRYVVREPYTKMPEYTYNGQSTYYASTCRECPAGCGIVVRTIQGRAIKVEGNNQNFVNLGRTCSRGQASLQGLYNPDRVQNPIQRPGRSDANNSVLTWDDAVNQVKEALTNTKPDEIAFLMGMAPDHLFDLVTEITLALKAPAPIRFSAHEIFDTRLTLVEASKRVFTKSGLPFFDLGNATITFSFGANFLETYLSPVAYSRGFASMRQDHPEIRGRLVQFEPRMSQTAATADEWIPITPGTEGLVASALGLLVAQIQGGAIPNAYLGFDIASVAAASGVSEETLLRLAESFAGSEHPLAIPGGAALGQSNGLESAQAILALNTLVNNLGQPGGVFLTPPVPVHPENTLMPNPITDVADLVNRMREGRVKTLFVHGINPVFETPQALGFGAALANVPLVISFASFPDETAVMSDFIFPDNTGLESWGYQKVITGSDRPGISGAQPTVMPFFNTRATADVLLAAIQGAGGELAQSIPYKDEVEFIEASLVPLVKEEGIYQAAEIRTFMTLFQQFGGWWAAEAGLEAPQPSNILNQGLGVAPAEFSGEGEFHLYPFMSPLMGDGSGANKPWLQETPDPTTTVMWNSWVEINPKTAEELGLKFDDVIRIKSPYGEIEAIVYEYPAIRPDIFAIPFGQGHTAYGQYAEGRGVNPAHLFSLKINGAGDLAFGATKVEIEKTGKHYPLSRLESKIGVYGEGFGTEE
jgi:anaerobic selenocysteine-containing dehydrogenase